MFIISQFTFVFNQQNIYIIITTQIINQTIKKRLKNLKVLLIVCVEVIEERERTSPRISIGYIADRTIFNS